MAWAVADRELHVADPRFIDVPTGALADKDYAAKARQVAAVEAGGAVGAGAVHGRPDTPHGCAVDDFGKAGHFTHPLAPASGGGTRRPGLEQRGYAVNRRTLSYDSYLARPQVIAGEKDGFLHGASDPRKDGGTALDTETE